MNEILSLPNTSSGFHAVSLITDGVNLRVEYDYKVQEGHRVGSIEFNGVESMNVYQFRSHHDKAPPKADTLYKYQRGNSICYLIWFYEDIILEVESNGYSMGQDMSGYLPQNFDDWRLVRITTLASS